MSRQWISVQNTAENRNQIICHARVARDILRPHGKSSCNFISVFGAARQGKSFLMNCLAGRDGIFAVSNSQDPCTQGVDLSTTLTTVADFSQVHGGQRVNEDGVLVGFVDVEGQGDRDEAYDAKLVCPILLCSKCVIFNWKDSLQRDRILKLLGVMQKAAYSVDPEKDQERSIFGHLHIVFRDWQYEGDEQSVRDVLFNRERSTDKDAIMRNSIRDALIESFASISIWLFPPPGHVTQQLSFVRTSAPFQAAVKDLRHRLAQQLCEPLRFHKKRITAANVPMLVETVVELLNSDAVIQPESAYLSMLRTEGTRIRAEFELQLRQQLTSWETRFDQTAMAEADVRTAVPRDIDEILHSYRVAIAHILENDATASMGNELIHPIETLAQDLQASVMKTYSASIPVHLTRAREESQRRGDKMARQLVKSLPQADQDLESSINELQAYALKTLCDMGKTIFGKQLAVGSAQYKDAVAQLNQWLQELVANIRRQNLELLQQGSQLIETALSNYDVEFDAFCSVKLNQQPALSPNTLDQDFENDYVSAASENLAQLLHENASMELHRQQAETSFEARLQQYLQRLHTQYLSRLRTTSQSLAKDAINTITTRAFSMIPTHYQPVQTLRATLDQAVGEIGTGILSTFAPWVGKRDDTELGQQARQIIAQNFEEPVLQHAEALWDTIAKRNDELELLEARQSEQKMQIEAPARKSLSKPRAKPTKSVSSSSRNDYSEEEDEEEEENDNTPSAPTQKRIASVRGAKIVKKKPQNAPKRPSTPPRNYDSEDDPPATTKARPASAKPAKPAKRVVKRAPSPPPSEEEDEEEEVEVKPTASRRKSSTSSSKAARARKREEPQQPSDDEEEDDEPVQEAKPEPRRPSVGKGRKSVGAPTGNAQDMLAAAREAAQREMLARAESRIGTLGGSPDPKSKRKRT